MKRPVASAAEVIASATSAKRLAAQYFLTWESSGEALPVEHADFDLGHIQAINVPGSFVTLQAFEQRGGPAVAEGFLQLMRTVRVEIVEDQMQFTRFRVTSQQFTKQPSEVGFFPLLTGPELASLAFQFHGYKDAASSTTFEFVILLVDDIRYGG